MVTGRARVGRGLGVCIVVVGCTSAATERPTRKSAHITFPHVLKPFGAPMEPNFLGVTTHHGTDFAVAHNGQVIAISDGVVVSESPPDPLFVGATLVIYHPLVNRKVIYAHFATIAVMVGQDVKRGQVIGTAVRPGHDWEGPDRGAGIEGTDWTPHVHLEICVSPCRGVFEDPMGYIRGCISEVYATAVVYPVRC